MKPIAIIPLVLACLACSAEPGDNDVALESNVADAPVNEAGANTIGATANAETALPEGALAFLRSQLDSGSEARVAAAAADLNGDGRDEVIAYVMGPMLCGSGGCNAYVLTPEGDGWRVAMNASVTQTPINLLPERTNGWSDLMVSVGGGAAEAGQVRMKYDGRSYPRNPTTAAAEAIAVPAGTALIAADDKGEVLP